MKTPSKRIAVLFHAGDRHLDPSRYIVDHLARFWREDGHEVVYLFGTRHYEPADALLVHVNLSLVPEEYIAFAARYPIALNTSVADIRKSTISTQLLRPGDSWDGAVIVKSDLNYAGAPERILERSWLEWRWRPARRARRLLDRLRGNTHPFSGASDYEIYDRLGDVPPERFRDPRVVVERFIPEYENGLYHTHIFQFLGDRWNCHRVAARTPIVKTNESISVDPIEPHPDVLARRRELGMDYGKLDYVVAGGKALIFDANKTTGASPYRGETGVSEERLKSMRRDLAEGIYSYFDSAPAQKKTG